MLARQRTTTLSGRTYWTSWRKGEADINQWKRANWAQNSAQPLPAACRASVSRRLIIETTAAGLKYHAYLTLLGNPAFADTLCKVSQPKIQPSTKIIFVIGMWNEGQHPDYFCPCSQYKLLFEIEMAKWPWSVKIPQKVRFFFRKMWPSSSRWT